MGGLDAIGALWQSTVVTYMAEALRYLYDFLASAGMPSWALAIILFTIAIRLITTPLTLQSLRSSRVMQDMQPALREVQKKYKGDPQKLQQEQMRVYKEYGFNPATGCLPMLIQMPIWIGLYGALATLGGAGIMTGGFLWISSLALPEGAPYILAILTGVTQWIAQKMMTPTNQDPQQAQMNRMMQFMPIMFIFFSFQVSAGLVLYWVTSNVIQMITQYFITGWGSMGDLIPSLRGASNNNGGRTAKPALLPKPATSGNPNGNEQSVVADEASDSGDAAVEQVTAQLTKRRRRARRR